MARSYQHLTAEIRRDIAKRVGSLLWDPPKGANRDDDGPDAVPARKK
jgi:hypothetical protein